MAVNCGGHKDKRKHDMRPVVTLNCGGITADEIWTKMSA